MKFVIITHAVHKQYEGSVYAYEPYVREMNLWGKYVSEIKIVAPISGDNISEIEQKYNHKEILLRKIPAVHFLNLFNKLKSFLFIPIIFIQIFKAMLWADHIHLRCPGNIGLLGCFVQILFPFKPKTVKYAGNWDPKSIQPLSYRFQKWILANTFLTKKCKVLVYGEWQNQSKNIIPFFTASYTKKEIIEIPNKNLSKLIRFIYVGSFSDGKQPLLSVKTIENLIKQNYEVQLDMYGNGKNFELISNYIKNNNLQKHINLHGNKSKEVVKYAYQKSHFLIFVSKSEGWPKVVAEAMFWKCLPISSKVSCIDYMLGFGERGTIVHHDIKETELVKIIKEYINDKETYYSKVLRAQKWSQEFVLEKFELEISKLLV